MRFFLPYFYPILLNIRRPSLSAISHILSRIYYAKNRIYYATIEEAKDTHYIYFNNNSGPPRSANLVTLTLLYAVRCCSGTAHIVKYVINAVTEEERFYKKHFHNLFDHSF